ncbi:hypothetical protein K523DRAFT_294171 [Schizophyllum commune Tattone D]|nr:hypothetical protein K523DRAFT_294171 [Schizophyllum commune Tattone D]
MAPIVFYDLASKVGPWSPTTWRIRYALNFKALPFRTEWVEYPDIEAKCKEVGAEPTGTRDGKPLYTVPVIQDPSTGRVVSDGPKIAKYLDGTYPETPKLFPSGTEAKQTEVLTQLIQAAGPSMRPLVVPSTFDILNEVAKPYFRETREKMFGCKLEEIAAKGEAREASLQKLRGAFEVFVGRLDESGKETPYLLGETPCYADFVVGANLQWLKALLGEESDLWKMTASVADGRLMKYLGDLRQYEGDWGV